jgi:hypothetical protein
MRAFVCTWRGEWPKTSMCPFVGVQQAEQQLDRRGFAGTVRAEQTENFAAPDFKIHIVHRARLGAIPEILENFGQSAHRDTTTSPNFDFNSVAQQQA